MSYVTPDGSGNRLDLREMVPRQVLAKNGYIGRVRLKGYHFTFLSNPARGQQGVVSDVSAHVVEAAARLQVFYDRFRASPLSATTDVRILQIRVDF